MAPHDGHWKGNGSRPQPCIGLPVKTLPQMRSANLRRQEQRIAKQPTESAAANRRTR